tara:strand:- start:288 stop:434 length:147 start_codon:yes stop_codon:yes gene_type:complete
MLGRYHDPEALGGLIVLQGKKESTRVQIRKGVREIADITIPYQWEGKS